MGRRILLSFLCSWTCFLALGNTSRAKSVTEVEGAAYQGSSGDNWGCGPAGRLHYGGLATQVRHSQRETSSTSGRGGSVVGGVAVELQRARTFGAPTFDSGIFQPSTDPPFEALPDGSSQIDRGLFGAAHARGGYHLRFIGAELGLAAWSGFDAQGSSARWVVLPQAEITLGPRDIFYVVGGFGVGQLTQIMRYSLPYLGVGVALGRRSQLELRLGGSRSGPAVASALAPRLDAFWMVPIDSRWSLRGGLGIADNSLGLDPEASLGFALRL